MKEQSWRVFVSNSPGGRLVAVIATALLAGPLFVLELDDSTISTARAVLVIAVGVVLVAAGLADAQRHARVGILLVLAGEAWLATRLLLTTSTSPTATAGFLLAGIWAAFLLHAIVTFPSGRAGSRFEVGAIVAGYLILIGLNAAYLLTMASSRPEDLRHEVLVALVPNADTTGWLNQTARVLTLVLVAVVIGHIAVKALAASPAVRRADGAAWLAGAVLGAALFVVVGAGLDAFESRNVYGPWFDITVALVALTTAGSLMGAQAGGRRLVTFVAEMETIGPGDTLRNALRRSLADPGLDIAYLRAGTGGWIDEVGRSMTEPVATDGRVVTAIERGGKPIAALVHDPVLLRRPERLRAAMDAASLAFDNEQLKADLRAELEDLRRSRSRIAAAGDLERRQTERNLHDGAQQRLVALAMMLRMAGRKAVADPAVTALLDEAAAELDNALAELRELARGIHPAILSAAGLTSALQALAERPGLPVELHVDVPEGLPDLVEAGAYYAVSEALTNAYKHSGADHVSVRAFVSGDILRVQVTDDGRGGAVIGPGSGLEGLADRVSALGGRLDVDSPAGAGTTISAELPVTVEVTAEIDPRRLTALRWVGWESFEIPAEAYDQLIDEDNLNWVRGVWACVGGVSRLTEVERNWMIGYQAAAGSSQWVLDALRAYDRDDTIAEISTLPILEQTGRGLLYDTLRVFSADGDLTPDELAQAYRAADALGYPHDLVDQLHRIVADEHALRRQRYELITAPVFFAT